MGAERRTALLPQALSGAAVQTTDGDSTHTGDDVLVLTGAPATPKDMYKRVPDKLRLEPPDFSTPDHGGTKRSWYSVEFKLNAVRYAEQKDPNGRGPGGTKASPAQAGGWVVQTRPR